MYVYWEDDPEEAELWNSVYECFNAALFPHPPTTKGPFLLSNRWITSSSCLSYRLNSDSKWLPCFMNYMRLYRKHNFIFTYERTHRLKVAVFDLYQKKDISLEREEKRQCCFSLSRCLVFQRPHGPICSLYQNFTFEWASLCSCKSSDAVRFPG